MLLDQFSVFFVIALLAAALTAYLAFNVFRLRPSPGVVPFSWMLAFLAIWTVAIAIGMLAKSEPTAYFWIIIRMVAVILTPAAWFFFVAEYTGRERLINTRGVSLILLVPLISLIALVTNGQHQLFHTGIEYLRAGQYLVDETWHLGPLFYLHLAYSYGLVLAGDYLLLREAARVSEKYKRQAFALVLSTLIPILVNISFVFHLIPGLKVNYDPVGFVIAGLILGWTIYFSQLFDLSPIARGILVDHMVDGMIVVNQHNRIVDLNPAAEKIFEVDHEVIGAGLDDLFESINLAALEQTDHEERYHIKLDNQDGVRRFYDIQTCPIFGSRSLRGKLITVRDITSQKRIEDQLQYLAITDSLTGLANHRHFYELLNNELERSKRSYHPFAVIMLDIDLFKKVNDRHGHLIGDQVLREISIVCLQALRQYDIFCRYGGEEFSVILPETDLQSATATAERLREIVESNEFLIGENKFNLTISLGVACYDPENPVSAKVLVGQADSSLYLSKENGRNQVTAFSPARAN